MIITRDNGEKFVVFQMGETIDTVIEEIFMLTLQANEWNIKATAASLGIAYKTARNWVKKYKAKAALS